MTQAVWSCSKAKGPARLVLLALADHADDAGRAWPSAARLARYTRMDVRNVHRALVRLIDQGEIVAAGRGRRGVIVYRITPGGNPSEPMAKSPGVEPTDLWRDCQMSKSSYDEIGSQPLTKSSGVPLAKSPDNPSIEPSIEPSLDAAAECQRAVDDWNLLAEELGLTRVQRLTSTRRSQLATRLADVGGIDGWRAALGKVRDTPGLRGENDRRWRADFDWLIEETHFAKIMEDRYADWGSAPANGAGRGGASSRKRASYDAVFVSLAKVAAGD